MTITNETSSNVRPDINVEQTDAQSGALGTYFAIEAQYIRDLSFEIPRTSQPLEESSKTSLSVEAKIGNSQIYNSRTEFGFSLKLSVLAAETEVVLGLFELHYAAVVVLPTAVASEEEINMLINIECTRLLLPYIRNIVIFTASNSPFAGIMDFDPLALHHRLATEYISRSQPQQPA